MVKGDKYSSCSCPFSLCESLTGEDFYEKNQKKQKTEKKKEAPFQTLYKNQAYSFF